MSGDIGHKRRPLCARELREVSLVATVGLVSSFSITCGRELESAFIEP
jgi:hypothetical protein